MRFLTASDILSVWEQGQERLPAEQAILILSAVFPEADRAALSALPLGQRDARLLQVQAALFGSTLRGFTECGACGERLEFTADTDALLDVAPPEAEDRSREFAAEGVRVRFRLPDSHDMMALAGCPTIAAGRALLIHWCLLEAWDGSERIEAAQLPDSLPAAIAEQMAHADPLAEILFDLSCPACGQAQQVLLDITAFLWAEISTEAKRLLHEVHGLARAYGWREADILAMGAVRRRFYLEIIG
jgi:hypothetical protein